MREGHVRQIAGLRRKERGVRAWKPFKGDFSIHSSKVGDIVNKGVDTVKDVGRTYANVMGNIATGGLLSDLGLNKKWGLDRMSTGFGEKVNPLADALSNYGSKAMLAIAAPYALGAAMPAAGGVDALGELAAYDAALASGAAEGVGSTAGSSLAAELAAESAAGAVSGAIPDAAMLGISGPEAAATTGMGEWIEPVAKKGLFNDLLGSFAKGSVALDKVSKLTQKQQEGQQKEGAQTYNAPMPQPWMNIGGGTNLADFMNQAQRFNQQQEFSNSLNKKPSMYGW